MAAEPGLPASLEFRSWLVYSAEVKLVGLLHKHGLLLERQRKRFVETANRFAVDSPEWRFMRSLEIRELFRRSELRSLRARVRNVLSSRQISLETEAYQRGWEDTNDDPEDFFWSWGQELDAFASEFYNNKTIYRRFVTAERKVAKLVERLTKAREEKDGSLEAATSQHQHSSRSVFEDVDQ